MVWRFSGIKDINLDVQEKQKIVICSPSGSGKSTLIRCINRLEEHQKGKIIDGNELSEKTKILRKSEQRWEWFFSNLIYFLISILDNCALAPI